MNLKLRNTTMGDIDMELSNLMNVIDLKKKYIELLKSKDLTKDEIEPG